MRIALPLLGLTLCLLSCASQFHLSGEHSKYQHILQANPMEEGAATQVINLDRTAGASYHLVRVRTAEQPHIHRFHDATAIQLEGEGTLHIRGHEIPMTGGSIVTIKRKAVHYYVNKNEKHPSVFYVIFTPPFNGKDRVIVRAVKDFLN